MAYKVIILYQLYMPSYFLGTFTEYPYYIILIISEYVLVFIFHSTFLIRFLMEAGASNHCPFSIFICPFSCSGFQPKETNVFVFVKRNRF